PQKPLIDHGQFRLKVRQRTTCSSQIIKPARRVSLLTSFRGQTRQASRILPALSKNQVQDLSFLQKPDNGRRNSTYTTKREKEAIKTKTAAKAAVFSTSRSSLIVCQLNESAIGGRCLHGLRHEQLGVEEGHHRQEQH